MVKKTVARTNINRENEPTVKQIDGNTQIIFTMKSFFALISSMLALFFGFYMLVVVPRINKSDEEYKRIVSEQKDQNAIFYGELNKINNSIGSLGASIEGLNKTERNNNASSNTGGSLGDAVDSRTATKNN